MVAQKKCLRTRAGKALRLTRQKTPGARVLPLSVSHSITGFVAAERGEGGTGGKVLLNLKTMYINWRHCMDGAKSKEEVISLVLFWRIFILGGPEGGGDVRVCDMV